MPKAEIYKNKRTMQNYTCCYTYTMNHSTQYIYVYYPDDAEAIDLLLEKKYFRQAKILLGELRNEIKTIRK